jgi:hypothetical protein
VETKGSCVRLRFGTLNIPQLRCPGARNP